jgi:hypothetical protein
MRLTLVAAGMLTMVLAAAPAATARTETARAGNVTATVTYRGTYPSFSDERLEIARSGSVYYSAPITAALCGGSCEPSAVHVVGLEGDDQRDVVLDLYTNGAHCCSIEQVFSFDPGTMTYQRYQHDFGDPGAELEDLDHDGRYEFLSADDSFAYEFTDFAASGLPVEVLEFSGGRFLDVTASYPRLIERDAARWLKAFKRMAPDHYRDSVGVIAAWAADEDRLGNVQAVDRFLARQARAGHLNTPLHPGDPSGRKFVAALQRFLERHGYLH